MTWKLPTVGECVAAVSAAFEAWFPGVDARLARNNLGPTATVVGGAHWQILARLAEIADDRFVHRASPRALLMHGVDLGIARKGAAAATGRVLATTSGAASIEIGALMRRADGTRFRATRAASIAGPGVVAVTVAALDPGTAGNTAPGSPLVALSGLTGEATLAVDDAGLIGGEEIEAIDAYRARLLARLAAPPQGGTSSDYWRWATSVAGCTAAYVWPRKDGAGRVTVYPVFDGTRSGGLPTTGDLAEVRQAIDAVAPSGALVSVAAFTPHPVAISIAGLSPATDAVKDAIRAELATMFVERSRVAGEAEPHPSLPMRATPFSFPRAWIEEAINRAASEARHTLAAPAADVALAAGERATLGTIGFA